MHANFSCWLSGSERTTKIYRLPADGAVRIPDAPSGEDFLIVASDRAGHLATARVPAGAPGSVLDFGTLRPAATASIQGSVTAADLQGASLHVHCGLWSGEALVQERTLVPLDGEYRIDGLVPGEARVELICGDARIPHQAVALRAGETVQLDLDLGGWIRGECVDEAGKGRRDVIVECIDVSSTSRRSRRHVRTDRLGRFAMAGLAPDVSWRVRVWGADPGSTVPELYEAVRTGAAGVRFQMIASRFDPFARR